MTAARAAHAHGRRAAAGAAARWLVLAGLAAGAAGCVRARPLAATSNAPAYRPAEGELVEPAGWPVLGKWMIAPDLTPAHWLGTRLRGKRLREPINVIVVDPVARTSAEAERRFLTAATRAGFPSRRGHSSGYWGLIGPGLQPQFPATAHHALADGPFELDNDHGRFFGPHRHGDRFIFVGALSREKVTPFAEVKHQYVSFNLARDRFAAALDERTSFKLTAFLDLANAILGHAELTTGDHDHMAAVLTAAE
jgi:hypothetical protein